VHTEEDIADIITLYGTLSGDELELALPSLCLLAERCPNGMKEQMMDLARLTLTDANSSRSARKAAISCLKTLTQGNPVWFNFFTLAQCLEEPQFHILNPVLPQLDIVLQSVYSAFTNTFKWAKVLFIRALAHSNGWVRLWALEKLSCEAANEIGVLTAFFSREDPSLFDRFVAMESSQELLRQPMDPLDMIKLALECQRDFQVRTDIQHLLAC
ncbi:hypothetical protein COOONC_25438, partial [Cooperia oncophora]